MDVGNKDPNAPTFEQAWHDFWEIMSWEIARLELEEEAEARRKDAR